MLYHRYPNIKKALHADCMEKVSAEIVSRDKKTRVCQCTEALRTSTGGKLHFRFLLKIKVCCVLRKLVTM